MLIDQGFTVKQQACFQEGRAGRFVLSGAPAKQETAGTTQTEGTDNQHYQTSDDPQKYITGYLVTPGGANVGFVGNN